MAAPECARLRGADAHLPVQGRPDPRPGGGGHQRQRRDPAGRRRRRFPRHRQPALGAVAMNDLYRNLAPISDAAWKEIEAEATRTLKGTLAARRLVDFKGPLGWAHSAENLGRTELLRERPGPAIEGR